MTSTNLMKLFLLPLFGLTALLLSCSKEQINSHKEPPSPVIKEGMVLISGGTYLRGNDKDPGNGDQYPEEAPVHSVKVSSFWIDQHEVTNREFQAFVKDTGYVTFAEKAIDPELFPQAPPEQLLPGATVFSPPPESINPRVEGTPWAWWSYRKGAHWRQPEGEGSNLKDRMDHPVVCVNIDDAKAYAQWAGKRLPTEAEWEFAARGGHEQQMFTWGAEKRPQGKWLANCFQGEFPAYNSKEDGYSSTAPVGSFSPNSFGLYDMAGNVWELCSDYYHPAIYQFYESITAINPQGPEAPITMQELEQYHQSGTCPRAKENTNPILFMHVARGGSFLCHSDYCLRYRPAARHFSESLSPTNHTGFRCVKDIAPGDIKK